jgi:DmsE family decaheme c-type cytochrome
MELKKIWLAAFAAAALAVPAAAQEAPTNVGNETCVACHADHAASFAKSMHGKKMALGAKAAESCESCHGAGSLHAAAGGDKTAPGFATVKNPAKTGSEGSKSCLACHKQKSVMLWSTSSHARASVNCTKCHSVHSGKGPMQLKKSSNESCYECHKKQKAEAKLPSHHPVAEGKMQCVSCHNPHGGPDGNLKAESVNETCFKCHAEKAGPFAYEHAPVNDSCLSCHKPHGSVTDNLLKTPMPNLCLSCHKNDHTASVTASGANAGAASVSIMQRQMCTNCHKDIHGSNKRPSFRY